MAELFDPTMTELSDCARRELDKRRALYPALIEAKKLGKDRADRELAMMEAIAEHLAGPAALEQLVINANFLRMQGMLAEQAELVVDARIRVPGLALGRLVEVRIAVTPMALNFVSREAERMLDGMNDAGGLQQEGEAPTCWRRNRGAAR